MPAASGANLRARGASKTEQLRAFEASVLECKKDALNEKNWTAVDKVFQAFSKTSNVKSLARQESLIVDLHWVMVESLKSRRATGFSLMAFLTKLCSVCPSSASLLRDRLRSPAVLTRIWLELTTTTHCAAAAAENVAKILDLLRHVCYGIRIDREEAFLRDLLGKLLENLNNEDGKISARSLTVLASLCLNNYAVVRIVLRILTDEQRRSIFVREVDDPTVQLLLSNIHFSLYGASSLSSTSSLEENVASYLNRIWDVVCTAYGEEDHLLLRMTIDFLVQLGRDEANVKTLKRCVTLTLLQHVFLVVDFTEGCNDEANSLMFRFANEAVRHHDDTLAIFELVVKTVLVNLESVHRLAHARESVSLLKTVFQRVELQMIDLSESDCQNLRLQVEQIVPTLCEIVQVSDQVLENRLLCVDEEGFEATYLCAIQVLAVICGIRDWKRVVLFRLKSPRQTLDRLANVVATFKRWSSTYCSVSVVVEIVRLCDRIDDDDDGGDWRDCCRDVVVSNDELMSDARHCTNPKHVKELADVLVSVSQNGILLQTFADKFCASVPERNCLRIVCPQEDLSAVGGEPLLRDRGEVADVLNSVTKAVEKMTIDESLADVLELGNFQLASQHQQMASLEASLKSADERISHSNLLNLQLKHESAKLNAMVRKLVRRLETTEKEMTELRAQHRNFEHENGHRLQKANEETERKTEALVSLHNDHTKLQAKSVKLKEHLEAMQETIREHQRAQDELREKLKAEGKNNADLTVALARRDEKLRKKEKMLDDQLAEKESAEKELETSRKECSSLQALTKRQEQVIAKKEKQLQDQNEELVQCRKIQAQIFNLSKFGTSDQ